MEANHLRCSNDDLRIFHSDLSTPLGCSSFTSLTFDSILIATSRSSFLMGSFMQSLTLE